MYAYQDDPFRSAPPHCAPGTEPEEVERGVSPAQAIHRDILAGLEEGNEHEAHGYDAQGFAEAASQLPDPRNGGMKSRSRSQSYPVQPGRVSPSGSAGWTPSTPMVNDRVLP